MSDLKKEKLGFIKRHGREIKPITKDLETLKAAEDMPADFETILDSKIEGVLEEFETKVFILEKSKSRPDQKKILVEADNPGAYGEIKTLIAALEQDDRCGGIIAVVSGIAAVSFQKDFGKVFSQVREKDKPVLSDILEATQRKPVDAVVATLSAQNAPDSVALFGSKSSLGAKKLFLVLDGWGAPYWNKVLSENRNNLEKIDGIFCNDELAKSLFCDKFPDFPVDKIYAFGTPALDSLDIEHGDEYRKSGREKLGIDENTKVLLYLGCVSSEAKRIYGGREDVDEKTFQDTFRRVVKLAEENPDQNFVFALRPHPRDDKKEEKYQFARSIALPPNLSFKDGGNVISMNEAAYG